MTLTTRIFGCGVPGRYFLKEKHFVPQYGYIDFGTITRDRCPGFFLIATGEEQAFVLAYPSSQMFVFYNAVEKRASTKTLRMERFTIPTFSVYVGYGHRQHVGA